MQVTVTLSHLLVIILGAFFFAIILYVLLLFKNIGKELSATAVKISQYQGRIAKLEGQMASIAANVHYMEKEAAGQSTATSTSTTTSKTRGSYHFRNISECFAEIRNALK